MDMPVKAREDKRQIFLRLKKLFLEGELTGPQYRAGLRHFDILPGLMEWRDFFRRMFTLAGLLLILAGAIMFLAWNWQDMPKWLKFGIFEAIFAVCAVLAVSRWRHWLGGPALLGAAVSIGALLALYGQIYQTGADSWELFRAWSLAVFPLFILSANSGVGFLAWLTGSLWAFLYLFGSVAVVEGFGAQYLASPFASRFLLLQLLIWIGLEGVRRFTAIDPGRNLTRIIGGVFILLITIRLAAMILISGDYGFWYRGQAINYFGSLTFYLYLVCQAGIFTFYFKKSPDLFFLTLGAFSAAALLAVILIKNIMLEVYNFGGTGALLLCGLLVIGLCIAGGWLVFFLRKRILAQSGERGGKSEAGAAGGEPSLPALRGWLLEGAGLAPAVVAGFFKKDRRERETAQPWYMKVPMAVGIWLGSLLLAAFLYLSMLDGLSVGSLAAFGVLFCAGGGALFRAQGFAVRQFGLALIFCGLCFSLRLLWRDTWSGCLLYAFVFLALWGFIRIFSARTICFAVALGLFYFLIHYSAFEPYDGSRYYHYYINQGQAAAGLNWGGQIFLAAATAFGLFILGRERRRGGTAASFLESAGAGAFLFALLEALFSVIQPLALLDWYGVLGNAHYGVCAGVAGGILLLAVFAPSGGPADSLRDSSGAPLHDRPGAPLRDSSGAPLRGRAALAAGGALLAGVAWFSPVSALGMLLLLLARRRRDNVLAGLAVAYLAVGVTFFYYYLGLAFLQKSLALVISGGVLLALALAAQRLLPRLAAGESAPARAAEGGE